MVPRTYAHAVQRAGGAGAAAAARRRAPTTPTRCSTGSTALLLAGGADVDPASYGAEPHPETELALARARPLRDRAGARARSSGTCRVLGDLPRDADAQRRPRAGRSSSTCPT